MTTSDSIQKAVMDELDYSGVSEWLDDACRWANDNHETVLDSIGGARMMAENLGVDNAYRTQLIIGIAMGLRAASQPPAVAETVVN